MEIINRGKTVILDVNTDDQKKAYELMCECGHKLSEHAMPIYFHSPDALHHTIYTRQCTHWKEGEAMKFCCEQFEVRE